MTSEEKIYYVLKRIKEKIDISPKNVVIEYRAGEELAELGSEDEIMILNKLADEEIIEVIDNFANSYI